MGDDSTEVGADSGVKTSIRSLESVGQSKSSSLTSISVSGLVLSIVKMAEHSLHRISAPRRMLSLCSHVF